MSNKEVRLSCLFVSGLVIFALAAIGLAESSGVDRDVLLRDPSDEFGIPIYAGLISEMGIAALFAATVLLFAAASVTEPGDPILPFAGGVTALFAFDDRFMLHERYAERFLGVGEEALYALYVVLAVTLVALRLRETGTRGHGVLWLSLAVLGASAGFDLFLGGAFALQSVVEDSLKLAGWGFWSCYWIGVALRAIRKAPAETGAGAASTAPAPKPTSR